MIRTQIPLLFSNVLFYIQWRSKSRVVINGKMDSLTLSLLVTPIEK